jgi:hypothetical protein
LNGWWVVGAAVCPVASLGSNRDDRAGAKWYELADATRERVEHPVGTFYGANARLSSR